jgi:hypothetical protein
MVMVQRNNQCSNEELCKKRLVFSNPISLPKWLARISHKLEGKGRGERTCTITLLCSPAQAQTLSIGEKSGLGFKGGGWFFLKNEDPTIAAKTIAGACSHFLNAFPDLIDGLVS